MSADAPVPGRAFFDTNVLVYAHDASEPRKRDLARTLILEHLGAGTMCTSTQALAEYFSVVTTKGETRLEPRAAAWLIEQLPPDAVVTPSHAVLKAAARRCASAGLSIWDALILEAAREAGAELLYREDAGLLRAGEGETGPRIVDPFVPS
jgi:predicted nucleic acid-binding protein